MTKYNKYEIYVDKTELATYIEENCIKDKYSLPNEFGDGDFIFVCKDKGYVNFLNEDGFIDGFNIDYITDYIKNPTRVSAEEFLIVIGYLEQGEVLEKETAVENLKVEDVHYLDSLYPSDEDCLWLSEDKDGDIILNRREGNHTIAMFLSTESLISLGKDLIQIGVSKQIEEESNED